MREPLLDTDGENRAVRAFLMHYGTPGLTVGQMKENMRLSGWLMCWPTWAQTQAGEHLTKAGAQDWLRHLFALEGNAGVKGREPDAEFLRLLTLCETSYYTATRALDVLVVDVEQCQAHHANARADLAAYVYGVSAPDRGQQ